MARRALTAPVAPTLGPLAERLLGSPLPIRVEAWDGSGVGPADAPRIVVRSPEALRRILWAPGELGVGRAYVAGDLDAASDIFDILEAFAGHEGLARARVTPTEIVQLLRAVKAVGALGRAPEPPPEEVRRLHGRLHSRSRDRSAISHHYDVGNDFYEHVLGPSMVYSCAYWKRSPAEGFTLEQAQEAKLDLICRKLGLNSSMRLLDVGCGWGSMLMHAAEHYGVRAVGVTLSREQAAYAQKRIADAGLADLVEVRLSDYRDVTDGPFDAISSIGMAEHVGEGQFHTYAATLFDMLRPGGRLLNHQIARRSGRNAGESAFIRAYVFPDGELSTIGTTVNALEGAGFEVRDVESLREHYALTLREWVRNLEAHWDECVALTSEGRARVWRLYMAGSAVAFEAGRIGINQVLAIKRHPNGASDMPRTRGEWLGQNG
jgi:cyclopropane-fatty-acyl-phospholipid synthase